MKNKGLWMVIFVIVAMAMMRIYLGFNKGMYPAISAISDFLTILTCMYLPDFVRRDRELDEDV